MAAESSLFGLFLHASFLVQAVIIILLASSVISWTLIFQRAVFLRQAEKKRVDFESQFWSGSDLNKLYDHLRKTRAVDGLAHIFRGGFREFLKLSEKNQIDPDAIMEGSQRAMRVAFSKEEDKLEQHIPILATIGSVSPYIGLLGTVWGIMTSFQALGSVGQATLSMVAPGISEALIATAIGLFAAIPAVIAYNRFSQRIERLLARYENFQEEFTSILHREVHSRGSKVA